MDIKDALELLKKRYASYVTQVMDGSDDPRFLKFSEAFSKALQDVIDELEK